MKKPALALLAALSLTACGAPAATVAPAAVATTHGASMSTTFATPDELNRSVLEAVERLTGKDVTHVKFSLYAGTKESLFSPGADAKGRLTTPNAKPLAESDGYVDKGATVSFGRLRFAETYTIVVHAYKQVVTTVPVKKEPVALRVLTVEEQVPAPEQQEVTTYTNLTNADLFRSATQFTTGAATGNQDQKAVCSIVTLQDAVFSGNADATVEVKKGDVLQPYGDGSTSADQLTSLVEGPSISVKKPTLPPSSPTFTQVSGL